MRKSSGWQTSRSNRPFAEARKNLLPLVGGAARRAEGVRVEGSVAVRERSAARLAWQAGWPLLLTPSPEGGLHEKTLVAA